MKPIKIALMAASAFALSAPAALAQYQPTQQYQQDLQAYRGDRADYEQARRDYETRRADWERQRDSYDRRWGYGAYERAYGAAPTWGPDYADGYGSDTSSYDSRAEYDRRLAEYDRARRDYDRRWGSGAYERAYGPPPAWSAADYGQDSAFVASSDASCNNSKTNRSIAGSVIGALIGSALGSNVAASGVRTEGAVLGALVGGGIGLGVGRASARCDDRGYYYSYDQTTPYRESDYDRVRRSGQYDYSYYNRAGCRLAPAPVSDADYRYVRVCPDDNGRYRITG